MKTIEKLSDLSGVESGVVLSIGNFDGVHRGHAKILRAGREIADEKGTDVVVLTFEPHPLAVVAPERAPGLLTPRPLKRKLLEELGVDTRLVIDSTAALLKLNGEEFMEEFLVKHIRPVAVVEGDDFNFGSGRSGNVEMLRRFGAEHGIEVEIVESMDIKVAGEETVRVSSTLVRYMLNNGHVGDAAEALGRHYRLVGPLVSGRGVGRELGFPTLNMGVTDQIVPAEGVYAGYVCVCDSFEQACVGEERLEAVFSIGQAHTFGHGQGLLIEAHVLGEFEEVCRGFMAMDFVERIREQRKFADHGELSEQIGKDCGVARVILEGKG